MGETIMVLFIFLILLIFGLVFYVRWQKGNVQNIQSEQTSRETVQLAQIFSTLPEVACSFNNVKKENCVDFLKVEAAEDILRQNQEYYYPYFRYSMITITEVYPNQRSWILYENELEETSQIAIQLPLSVYDSREKAYYFGYMEVLYYEPGKSIV